MPKLALKSEAKIVTRIVMVLGKYCCQVKWFGIWVTFSTTSSSYLSAYNRCRAFIRLKNRNNAKCLRLCWVPTESEEKLKQEILDDFLGS